MSLILQRYYFFCKSQHVKNFILKMMGCLWYYKGTIFFANHNIEYLLFAEVYDVFDITKVLFFLQITTYRWAICKAAKMSLILQRYYFFCKSQQPYHRVASGSRCLWYYKGTIFFANHNICKRSFDCCLDVFDITKVLFFLQITTKSALCVCCLLMSLILQRYYFFCKSQRHAATALIRIWCLWYYKGTIFFANHNVSRYNHSFWLMSLILQRYYFFCKSQLNCLSPTLNIWCLWYYKGTIFFANHNRTPQTPQKHSDVFDITKVLFFLQITTASFVLLQSVVMSLILQRYYFFCKSQPHR